MICFFAVLVLSAIFFMMRFKQEDEFVAAVVSLVVGLFIGFIGCFVGHLYGTANMGAVFGFLGGYVFMAGLCWLYVRQPHRRDLNAAIRMLELSLEREAINREEESDPTTNGTDVFSEEE